MTAIAPEFLKVLPSDIGQVGALGACVLALVRYATSVINGNDGRMMVDGVVWWRATHTDIGEALGGVDRQTVCRAVSKLVASKHLDASAANAFHGDRAMAYRASDQAFASYTQGLTCDWSESINGVVENDQRSGRNRSTEWSKMTNLPISREREEKGEKAVGAQPSGPRTPAPSATGNELTRVPAGGPCGPRCRKPGPCGGCADLARQERERLAVYEAEENARREAIRAAIDACGECDGVGRLDDQSDCPEHPNLLRPSKRGLAVVPDQETA